VKTENPDEVERFLPHSVRSFIEQLEAATGHPTQVEPLGGGRYRIIMANDRVRMTYDCRATGQGNRNLKRSSSTLQVDGVAVPLARDLEHFALIFRDPDKGLAAPAIEPMPAAAKPEKAPELVRVIFETFQAKAGDKSVAQLGFLEGTWIVALNNDSRGATLRLNFTDYGDGLWWFDKINPAQLLIGGEDHSQALWHELKHDVSRALAMAIKAVSTGKYPKASSVTPAMTQAFKGITESTGVQVRRTKVMRN
jgi:hypothetical protein